MLSTTGRKKKKRSNTSKPGQIELIERFKVYLPNTKSPMTFNFFVKINLVYFILKTFFFVFVRIHMWSYKTRTETCQLVIVTNQMRSGSSMYYYPVVVLIQTKYLQQQRKPTK
jgi:hypothetical protein